MELTLTLALTHRKCTDDCPPSDVAEVKRLKQHTIMCITAPHTPRDFAKKKKEKKALLCNRTVRHAHSPAGGVPELLCSGAGPPFLSMDDDTGPPALELLLSTLSAKVGRACSEHLKAFGVPAAAAALC